jgi:predicted lipoprotein with Yx(FWY)xxD motif
MAVRVRQDLCRILERMLRYRTVLLAAAATLAAGCGADDRAAAPARAAEQPTATAAPARDAETRAPARKRRRGTRIRAIDSQFGTILGDRRGQAVYLFDREESRKSECYGDCA